METLLILPSVDSEHIDHQFQFMIYLGFENET